MALETEAASPASAEAQKRDGQGNGSGGLTADQAAARLFAHAARATTQKPPAPAAEETTTEQSAPSDEPSAAEAPAASAEAETVETPPAETTANADEPAASETTAPADEVLSPATQDEKLKAKVQKRINEEVAARKKAEGQIAMLEARLAQLTSNPAAETATQTPAGQRPAGNVPLSIPNQPLGEIQDLAALNQHTKLAKDAMRWAEDTLENPRAWKNKTEVDSEGNETTTRITTIGKDTYDEAQIRAIRREAKIALEDHIPARRDFLNSRQSAQKTAHESYPFLKDKTAPDYQLAQSMLRDPWVQMRPDAEWIVGTQIMGMRALESQRTAAKKTAEPVKPKTPAARPSSDQSAVSASGSPSRVSQESGQRLAQQSARKELVAKGGVTAAEAAAFLQRNSTNRKSG